MGETMRERAPVANILVDWAIERGLLPIAHGDLLVLERRIDEHARLECAATLERMAEKFLERPVRDVGGAAMRGSVYEWLRTEAARIRAGKDE